MENLEQNNSDEIILNFSLKECKENCKYSIEVQLKNDSLTSFETEEKEKEPNNSIINFSRTLNSHYYFYKIQPIKIFIKKTKGDECFYKYELKTKYNITLSTIVNSKNSLFQYPINNENSEIIMITAEKPNNIDPKKYIFFDYLKAGISFDVYIVIDFSQKTEHTHAMKENIYINCIGGIRKVLSDFLDTFEVYGYGPKLKMPDQNNNNSLFFNLNLNGNKILKGRTEIMRAYEQYLDNLDFCNINNVLSPLMKNILRRIYEKYELTKYNILFLLMNNSPKKEDYQKFIDVLIESSLQPLSIVVIYIGEKEDELKKIKNLCSTNTNHSNGMKRSKNNIFFVSMKECKNDVHILENICLKEVPKQMVEFYKIIKTTPNDIRHNNLNNIKNSLNILDYGSLIENDGCAPPIKDENKEKNEINEINIYESHYLIEENYKKQNVNKDENDAFGYNESQKIENNNINDNNNNNNNNDNENNLNEIKESFRPKVKIGKRFKKDSEKFLNNLENGSKFVENKNDNEQYTNTPLERKECTNKENNPYGSKYINTPKENGKNNKNIIKNIENPYDLKFINTPKKNGENNQNNSKNNPYKASAISEESTMNSIKQSCKNSALVYNLNKSQNKINQNNNIKDYQQYNPYPNIPNYSIDDN